MAQDQLHHTTGRIRIVLADDHQVVRSGLRLLLDREHDFEVVAEAGDVDAALRYVRGHHPDVLILDLNMPGASSSAAIASVRSQAPETKVVVLTMDAEPSSARDALAAGAVGYVLKEATHAELVQAIHHAVGGGTYLSPRLGARIASEPEARALDDLSNREIEVLRLIGLGHTNVEIAAKLFISVRTVESHRSRIQHKLHLTTRAELVRYAIERGLLDDTA